MVKPVYKENKLAISGNDLLMQVTILMQLKGMCLVEKEMYKAHRLYEAIYVIISK